MLDNNGAFRLCRLQSDVGQWSRDNFGAQPSTNPLLGLVEEVGELSHAHLKDIQGIRHDATVIRVMKVDAIGDIMIYLADYCEREGIDLEGAVMITWKKVSKRNWADKPLEAADGEDQDHD